MPSYPAARLASTAPSSPAAQSSFYRAEFSGGIVGFGDAKFSGGSRVIFEIAEFSGGEVNFRHPCEWTEPPHFDWPDSDPAPAGVMLPDSADATLRHEPGSAVPRQP